MTRRHNVQRAREHLCYTARELAALFYVDIRTVRKWIAAGLKPIDRHVPHLFRGTAVREFLRARNKPFEPLQPGEFYCVACKAKRLPMDGIVALIPRSETTADFKGRCCHCRRHVYRRVRLTEVEQNLGAARLVYEDEATPVGSSGDPLERSPSEEIVA